MRYQLNIPFLILELVFYLSTDVNGNDEEAYKDHKKLYETVVRKPTTSELTNAISSSTFSQKIQIENLQQFFCIGQYQIHFIHLLNKYKTLSHDPVKFNDGEVTTLTSNYDDESLNSRILTQLKFYRKLQEIQCTNYVLLEIITQKIGSKYYVNDIAKYVYCMIAMSYEGKHVVSTWLWELHIQLLGLLQGSTLKILIFLNKYLPEINETLHKLITSCHDNKYLEKNTVHSFKYANDDVFLGAVIDLSYQKFIENKNPLPVGIDNFVLNRMWTFTDELFSKIPGLTLDWENTYYKHMLTKHIEEIEYDYYKKDWTTLPFKYIINPHKIILDVIKAKWYSYIWSYLVAYQNAGSKARPEYDSFIQLLNELLKFAYIEDQIFNKVLILLSDIYVHDDKKIHQLINILADEVNRILSSATKPDYKYKNAIIDDKFVKKFGNRNYSKFLQNHALSLESFVRKTYVKMCDLKFSVLLFYINGSLTTDFVFPNE